MIRNGNLLPKHLIKKNVAAAARTEKKEFIEPELDTKQACCVVLCLWHVCEGS